MTKIEQAMIYMLEAEKRIWLFFQRLDGIDELSIYQPDTLLVKNIAMLIGFPKTEDTKNYSYTFDFVWEQENEYFRGEITAQEFIDWLKEQLVEHMKNDDFREFLSHSENRNLGAYFR